MKRGRSSDHNRDWTQSRSGRTSVDSKVDDEVTEPEDSNQHP